jgi:hypothetical protein
MAANIVSKSDHETRSKESGTIRTLLKHCLDMLNPEKFPEYHCAAAYMMSDLFIDDNVSEQSWTSDGSDIQDPESLDDDVINDTLVHDSIDNACHDATDYFEVTDRQRQTIRTIYGLCQY